jgi:hypothetical protein
MSFTPRPLYPQGKSPWYPLDRRLGEPQSHSGRGGVIPNKRHRDIWDRITDDAQSLRDLKYRRVLIQVNMKHRKVQ